MTDERMVECRDLEVKYGNLAAVRGVTFGAEQGEVVGLLGPNGAGKTSVIRALTTIVAASGGTATIAGHRLDQPQAIRSAIGVLPESNGYPTAQTAIAYLRFHGQLFGLTRSEANTRGRRLLEQLGLADVRRPIGTFSRGMRQRLGLCRAMINQPAVLFLDEPTLGLDPAGQEEIMAHFTRTAIEEGTCVILCSHLLDEVERVCDRVTVMHQGRIVASGTVDHVVAAAGVSGTARVTVPEADIAFAGQTLEASRATTELRFDNNRPGDIEIELSNDNGARSEVLRLLLNAGIVPRAFDLQGARLSDAFLALTNEELAA